MRKQILRKKTESENTSSEPLRDHCFFCIWNRAQRRIFAEITHVCLCQDLRTFSDKLETGPFIAVPRKLSVHHTMSGGQINTKAKVLDTDGNVIFDLFASGKQRAAMRLPTPSSMAGSLASRQLAAAETDRYSHQDKMKTGAIRFSYLTGNCRCALALSGILRRGHPARRYTA